MQKKDDELLEEDYVETGTEDKTGFLPWCILGCVCFITFGSYWCFDTPAAIYKQLRLWFGPTFYTESMNLLLYSVYSYPNVVLAFGGGFIIDRLTGPRIGALLFCSFVLTGQIIFSLGVQTRLYWLAVVGRFVFGLGAESLTVAQNTFCARWAPEGMLALWFGIVVSCSRIGSSINFIVTPKLAEIGVPVSVWAGVGTCALSLLFCSGAAALDYYGRHRIKENNSAEAPSLRGVLRFPPSAWVLFLTCVLFYGAVLTFYTVASDIMQNTGYMYSPSKASALISIPNIVAIFGCPYFGWFVDQHGRALVFIIVGALMLVVTHFLFLGNALEIWLINPIPVLIWMGVAYSIGASSMWPIISLAVPAKLVATAYGAMSAVQNLGLAVFPQIIGAIGDNATKSGRMKRGYAIKLSFFIILALLAALVSFGNIFLDKKFTQGRLNASGEERRMMNEVDSDVIQQEEEKGRILHGDE